MRKEWFHAAAIRAIKTMAQTAIATIGTSAVMSAVDWKMVASASLLAGILSILTSTAGLPEVPQMGQDDDYEIIYDEQEEEENYGEE